MDYGLPHLLDDGSAEINDFNGLSYLSEHNQIFGAYDESTTRHPLLDVPTELDFDQGNMLDIQMQYRTAKSLTDVDIMRENQEIRTHSDLSSSPKIVDLDLPEAQSPLHSFHNTELTKTESPTALPSPQAPDQQSVGIGSNLGTRRIRKLAKPATKADWVKFRPLITTLYGRMTLHEVIKRMEREHGFVSS